MSYEITPGNVEWVKHRVSTALDGGQFNTGEVIIGVAEVLGRIIVGTAGTPVQGAQCMQIITDHLTRTLQAGYAAKGYNMGPANG